ncbi:DUF1173 family protein [Burkholderia stagnalis]|uniref:DUF1173 family protein n=1 Tax=Burkholderia stagnalis TaxID=1503054 RepID=UPI0009BE87C1|nr:DUF1173 family protein [Burkholderia stagnalis]
MTNFKIGDTVYSADDPRLSEALATAYASQTLPRCLCRDGGIEMGIAKRGAIYAIKPGRQTGAQHSLDCEFYEP